MAIKDSIISQVLKREATVQSSQVLYKRLREVPAAEETEHKAYTNRTQTEYNNVDNPDTKLTQTNHNQTQTEHKLDTEPNTNRLQTSYKVATNQTQTEHKTEHKMKFMDLIGVQKKLMIVIYENCKKNGARITDPLTLEDLSNQFKIKIYSIKTSICRLESKHLLIRLQFKNGRGGWSIYEIPDRIYQEIYSLESSGKLNTNLIQTEHKPNTELDTFENHYNSSNNFITTIGEGWDEIDISPLEEIHFDKSHLKQLKECNANPEIVQASIYYFAFERNKISDAKERNEKYHLKLIMGVLRKGNAWSKPSGYLSPQEQILRRIREERKAEEGRAQEEYVKLFSEEFQNWNESLKEDEKVRITAQRAPSFQIEGLKKYFKENVWPAIWAEIKK
jgi:hypothetical protein